MELPEDIPHRAPPRHSVDVRHASSARHSIDLSRAHSVRAPGATAAQASTLSRGSTSQTDNSSWDNVSDENKNIIRQVNQKALCLFVNARAGLSCCMAVQVALKCADIGHLAASPGVHKRWALLLEEEFFLQVSSESAQKNSHTMAWKCPELFSNTTIASHANSSVVWGPRNLAMCRGTGRSSLGWLSVPLWTGRTRVASLVPRSAFR